jgi:dTDP-4-dehydrorhamnose reductase
MPSERKPLVWITGAGGLIGRYLLQSAPRWAPDYRAQGLTRPELDLTNPSALQPRSSGSNRMSSSIVRR